MNNPIEANNSKITFSYTEDKKLQPSKYTAHLEKLMNPRDENCPIAKQFIANKQEETIDESELFDPIGDDAHGKIKGIIHRYPDRALIIPKQDCLVNCRFCFRKWKLPEKHSELNIEEIDTILDYVKNHSELWEVILTGGEPLATKTTNLKYLLINLSKIVHVKIIRIHSRLPIVAPEMITPELIKTIKTKKTTYLVTHCNHPKEINKEVSKALALFADNGIPLLCQSVLLKGINDTPDVIEALMRKLTENRVKPYYLHHGDLVEGTSHLRTTIEEGRELIKTLRGRVSGLCWPTYVLDIPNGYGKVPLGTDYIEYINNETYVYDYKGNKHLYPPKKTTTK